MKQMEYQQAVSRRGFLGGMLSSSVSLLALGALPALAQSSEAEQGVPADSPGSDNGSSFSNDGVVQVKPSLRKPVEAHIRVNQVGYLPGEAKRAVLPALGVSPGSPFCILDDDITPEIRFRGTLQAFAADAMGSAQDLHLHADFSALNRPGRYRLRLADGRLSAPFSVGSDLYGRLTPLMLRYFDVQCCGEPRSPLRARCHGDDGVIVGGPRNGQPLDGAGGWHDAGDYLKFVETTSYVAALMLFAYEQFPKVFHAGHPDGSLPPILAQARIGLEWLLKMHPAPGEFYYQVGDASDHDNWRLPEEDCLAHNKAWKPRPVFFGVGANLAGRTAAALAMASWLYRPYDRTFAQRCLKAAQSVYQLGLDNPLLLTTNPADFYPEKTWEDDMEWGAAALYRATRQERYLQQACAFATAAGPAYDATSVYNTHALAHFMLYPEAPRYLQEKLLGYLKTDADLVRRRADNPYGLGTDYSWGTAEGAAGAALSCLLYAALSKEAGYTEIAQRQRDFILGCNPFGICCLIGAGSRYALFPHHPVADLSHIELVGALIGGPADLHAVQHEKIPLREVEFSVPVSDDEDIAALPGQTGVYQDLTENYVTNEPANDYTAKFLLLTAFYIGAA